MVFADEAPVLHLRGRARDLLTRADGEAVVLGETSLTVAIDRGDGSVASLDPALDPTDDPHWAGALEDLVGRPGGPGFRRAVATHLPDAVEGGTRLGLLLDEVPVTLLVSSASLGRRGLIPLAPGRASSSEGICAGWRVGGDMVRVIDVGDQPYFGEGPYAGALEDPDDPLAWHELPPLPPTAMRRLRRLDLVGTGDADLPFAVDVLFRDSYCEADGRQSGVHEYGVTATLGADGTVASIEAVPHTLPSPDCPAAAASAHRLVGMPLENVREHVRRSFVGESTCTHLNDTLRSLGDLAALRGLVAADSSPGGAP